MIVVIAIIQTILITLITVQLLVHVHVLTTPMLQYNCNIHVFLLQGRDTVHIHIQVSSPQLEYTSLGFQREALCRDSNIDKYALCIDIVNI